MRKNGIDRKLIPVEGGVCAPEGFKANGVACGIREDGSPDLGMIFSERRCAVACVYSTSKIQGAPVCVSKQNMRYGYARAVLVNGGVANALAEDGEAFAKRVCDLLFRYSIERTEIVVASTGRMGERLDFHCFERGIPALYEGLNASSEHSLLAAQAMRSEGKEAKQLSFTFHIGDYPCKVGAIFKGDGQTAPNMATFLAFLTTDVNITTPMLQKALATEARETLNMLNIGGVSSPNDTVCIMANGRAGNYKIDREDSEYKKFALALRLTLTEICLVIAKQGAKQVVTCRVLNANSKELARYVAKTVVGLEGVKKAFNDGEVELEGLLCAVASAPYEFHLQGLRVFVSSKNGRVCLYEDERRFPLTKQTFEGILSAAEVELELDFQEGNFHAVAFGRIS